MATFRMPAFPRPSSQDSMRHEAQQGMELRDYFAAKAMHSELVTAGAAKGPAAALAEAAAVAGRSIEDHIAFNAYKMADAMMRWRQK